MMYQKDKFLGQTIKSWKIIYRLYRYDHNGKEPFSMKDLRDHWDFVYGRLDPEKLLPMGMHLIELMDTFKDDSKVDDMINKIIEKQFQRS